MFVRFVIDDRTPISDARLGVIQAAYALLRDSTVSTADRARLRALLDWFNERLGPPDRFNRTKSKGYHRRETAGIAWFKDTAAQHIARMREIGDVLERNGHHVTMLTERKLGYVVYEDDHQVIAEPFNDTKT